MWHVDTTGERKEGSLAVFRTYTGLPGGGMAQAEIFLKEIQYVPGTENAANAKRKRR